MLILQKNKYNFICPLFSVFTLFYLILEYTSTNVRNFVFLVILDTCDVIYNWSISLLLPIVLDNLFVFRSSSLKLHTLRGEQLSFKGEQFYRGERPPHGSPRIRHCFTAFEITTQFCIVELIVTNLDQFLTVFIYRNSSPETDMYLKFYLFVVKLS